MDDEYKKHCKHLFIIFILTIISGIFFLNRFINFIDFPLRIYFEHIFYGFTTPLIILTAIYFGYVIYKYLSKDKFTFISKKYELIITFIGIIITILFEIYWQFCRVINSDSTYQFITSILGIVILIVYLEKNID